MKTKSSNLLLLAAKSSKWVHICLIQFRVALRELLGWDEWMEQSHCLPATVMWAKRWLDVGLSYLLLKLWSSFLCISLSHVTSFISCILQLCREATCYHSGEALNRMISAVPPWVHSVFSTQVTEQFNLEGKKNSLCVVFVSWLKCNAVNIRESHHTSPTTVTWLPAVLSLLPSTRGWGGGKVLPHSLPSDSFQSLKYNMHTSLIISESSGRHKRVDSQRILNYSCRRRVSTNARVNLRLYCTSKYPKQQIL